MAIMHRLVQLFLFVTFINYSLCNCMEKLKRCDKAFQDEMKAVKWITADKEYRQIYYDICSNDGIYNRFVNCVQPLRGQCDDQLQFRKNICQNREVKMNTWRYTWKPNLINDVCYRTLPIFDVEFFKHEKCISKVLNPQKTTCDTVHYKNVKSTNGLESCSHWEEFRKCSKVTIQNECGVFAANLSDYLFHTHNFYFTKYKVCNFTGEPFTECWYDWLMQRLPLTTQAVINSPTTQQSVSSTEQAAESFPDMAWTNAPKHHSDSYVSVKSNEQSSTVETTEWSKAASSTHTSKYEEVHTKESSIENEDSLYSGEDNSIHEEKHSDLDDEDDESYHEEEKVINESSESYEGKKSRKHMKHSRRPIHRYPIVPSISPELYLNDADLKTNGTEHEASAQQMDKSLVSERKSKALPSNSSLMNSEASNLPSVGGNSSTSTYAPISSLLSILMSLLILTIFTI